MKTVILKPNHQKTFEVRESTEFPGWFFIVTNDGEAIHLYTDNFVLMTKEIAEKILNDHLKKPPYGSE